MILNHYIYLLKVRHRVPVKTIKKYKLISLFLEIIFPGWKNGIFWEGGNYSKMQLIQQKMPLLTNGMVGLY